MTRFRLGISEITQHQYRYKRHTANDLLCPMCKRAKEDELHFLLCCPAYDSIRTQCIPAKFYRFPSQFRLSLLLACEHESTVLKLAVYLYKAFKLRSIVIS